jgi:transposase
MQFVTLRAQGQSFSRISIQLNVSRQTLIAWNRQFQSKLRTPRALELKALQECLEPEEEMIRCSASLRAVEQEITSRAFEKFTMPQLHRLAVLLRERLTELSPVKERSNSRSSSVKFSPDSSRLVKAGQT